VLAPVEAFDISFESCGFASLREKVLIVHLSSLESHLYVPAREEFANKLYMANIPVETNQGTLPKGDPCAFLFFINVYTPLIATLNIPGLNVGLPIWLWSTLNIQDVLEDSHMNALFQGNQMGVNCSSSLKEKFGIPLCHPSYNKRPKTRERRRRRRRIVISNHHQPLQVMLRA